MSADEVLIGITVFIVVVGVLLAKVFVFLERHPFLLLLIGWLIGRHHGERKTDATFFRRGTKVLHPSGRASKWAHRPHSHRMAVRWGVIGGTFGTGYGLLTSPDLTYGCLAAVGMAGIGLGLRRADRKIRLAHHQKSTVGPLTTAVSDLLGMSYQATADAVQIDPGYASAGNLEKVGTIILPDDYAANPGQKEAMEHLLRSRLGIDPAFSWKTAGYPMVLEISVAPKPPALVPLGPVLGKIRELPAGKVLLGVTGRGENMHWDMNKEDPHCLVSANTRRGKTRLLLLIASQVLAQGGTATLIDPKRVGVDTALAGVTAATIYSDPRHVDQMWKGIKDFRGMMDDRINAYMEDRTLEFPRALLCIDELSQFTAMSKIYWDSIREPRDKAKPPIWDDVAAILWQGAQFACSVIVFGQRVEHSTLAGLIDSFGTRLLAGYQKKTHERLVGMTPYIPSQKPRGRFLYTDGSDQVIMQTVLGSDQEIRELALSGQVESVQDTVREAA